MLVLSLIIYGWFYISQAKKNSLVEETNNYQTQEANVDGNKIADYKKIAGSGNLELYFEEGKGTIRVKNTDSGYIWKSIVEDEDYPKVRPDETG